MSFPKFTAEASLGNCGDYSNVGRRYKYDDDNTSIRIEPQFIPSSCRREICYTQTCRYICGNFQWCDGTQLVCEYYCCGDEGCTPVTASTYCGPDPPRGPIEW